LDIKEDLALGKVKSKYDEIIADDAFDDYLKKKGIRER